MTNKEKRQRINSMLSNYRKIVTNTLLGEKRKEEELKGIKDQAKILKEEGVFEFSTENSEKLLKSISEFVEKYGGI